MAKLKDIAQLAQEHIDQVQKLTGNYPLPTHRRALLYSRYSSAKQVVASIVKGLEQADGLMQRAINLGWIRDLATLFIENQMTRDGRIRSVSGTIPIEDRAGISTVIEHVKQGAGAILVDDISRLTRDADLTDAVTLARVCKQNDCEIITNDRRYNFKRQTDYDAYIAEAQAAAAFLELHIKGKMLKNRTRKAEQGKVANGTAPIGLQLDETGNNLTPSPHANGVNWLYTRFAELEASRNGVLRETDAMARAGKPLFPVHPGIDPKTIFLRRVYNESGELLGWTPGSRAGLTDLLTNPAYIGHLVFNGQIVKRNAHPAIVNPDLWQYAFDHLASVDLELRPIERATKTVRYSYPESEQTALLSGVRHDSRPVIDGTNGLHVYVNLFESAYVLRRTRGSTYTGGYETSIKTAELDSLIVRRLLILLDLSQASRKLFSKDNYSIYGVKAPNWHDELADFEQATQDRKSVPDDTLETLEGEIALVEQDLQYSSGVMDIKTRTGKYEQLARLNQRRDRLQQAQENRARIQRRLEKARRDVQYASERWHKWDLEQRRLFIHVATDSITLEEIEAGWLKIDIQWSEVMGGFRDEFYIWRVSGTLWSGQEVRILEQNYPTASRIDLLKLLPTRSWLAISRKAAIKGIRRTAKSDPLPDPFTDTTSFTDVAVLEMVRSELSEDELRMSSDRLFLHTTQASELDRGTGPGDGMVEGIWHGQLSTRFHSAAVGDQRVLRSDT